MAAQYFVIQPTSAQTTTYNTQAFGIDGAQFGAIAGCTVLSGAGTATLQLQVQDPVNGTWSNYGSPMTILNTAATSQNLALANIPFNTARFAVTIAGTSITFSIIGISKNQL